MPHSLECLSDLTHLYDVCFRVEYRQYGLCGHTKRNHFMQLVLLLFGIFPLRHTVHNGIFALQPAPCRLRFRHRLFCRLLWFRSGCLRFRHVLLCIQEFIVLFPVKLFPLLLFLHADEAFLHPDIREKFKVLVVDFVNIDIFAFLFQPLIIGKRLWRQQLVWLRLPAPCAVWDMDIWLSLPVSGLVKCRVSEWDKLAVHNRIKATDKNNALLVVQLAHFVRCEKLPAKHVVIA